MSRSVTTIVGLGIVTALFLAVMSMLYLQQIPTQADLDRVAEDVRVEHGLYLSSAAPIEMKLVRPQTEDERTGIHVRCMLRADIRKQRRTVELYLTRIAESIIDHPDWRGRIGYVTVFHSVEPDVTVTRFAAPKADKKT